MAYQQKLKQKWRENKLELWKGRFTKNISEITNDFNQSIHIDKRLYKYDITGSIFHSRMLEKQKIISQEDQKKIEEGLNKILENIESGELEVNPTSEDIHTFVEEELTKLVGDSGKKLHTARSRNDQVTFDLKMYLKDRLEE